jgi:hypothetical protein
LWKNQFITTEQDDDGQEAGCRLEVQRRDVVGEAFNDADRYEPRDERGGEGDEGTRCDRLLMRPLRADHTCGDGRQYQDALQPFTEDEHPNVEHPGAKIAVRSRVRQPPGPQHLEHQNGGDGRHAEGQEK